MKNIKKKIVLSIVAVLLLTSIIGIATTPVMAHTENNPDSVDLFAGQHIDVGDVIVWNDAVFLYVKYSLIDGWCLTETHLHVATNPGDIPQTKKENPIPGHFDYKEEHDGVISFTYEIPMSWGIDTELSIAAHAVVQKIIGYESDLAGLEVALPDQVTMKVAYPGIGYGDPSYFDVTITGDPLTGEYEGWCVDTDHTISPGADYTANIYSSYETLPPGLVEYPENLDLVNWIINQVYIGQPSACGGVYTYGDVQRAIWALVEDGQSTSGLGPWSQCRVGEILATAYANGEGFEPNCGDVVAVILAPVDYSQVIISQVTFAEVGVPCIPIYQEETAWGAGDTFNDKNWATYFTYSIQGWNLIGEWTLRFKLVDGVRNYDHDMTITTQDGEGNIAGNGAYPSPGPPGPPYSILWSMTGTISGNEVDFEIVYGSGYTYTVWATGIIDEDGLMSGTWTSSAGQAGTWISLSGAASWGNLPT